MAESLFSFKLVVYRRVKIDHITFFLIVQFFLACFWFFTIGFFLVTFSCLQLGSSIFLFLNIANGLHYINFSICPFDNGWFLSSFKWFRRWFRSNGFLFSKNTTEFGKNLAFNICATMCLCFVLVFYWNLMWSCIWLTPFFSQDLSFLFGIYLLIWIVN